MSEFTGFNKDVVEFFVGLRQHNDKVWFEERKAFYQQQIATPAQLFVSELGKRLQTLVPGVIWDTRLNGAGSIFRIYRDTRFSKDKSPYKTYLGIYLWEGPNNKLENSGFYLHLEPPNLMLGVGLYQFPTPVLHAYRDAVVDPKRGPALAQAIQQIADTGQYGIGGQHYKRIPRGYPADHPYAQLLLHNGLYASWESPVPEAFFSDQLVDFCLAHFAEMLPIHQWLVTLTEQAAAKS